MSSEDIAIKVENISKNFVLPHEKVSSVKGLFTSVAKRRNKRTSEVQHALKDISFEVKKGEFFGIVGRNGSGKSTLLKILAGIYQPTSGTVQTHGKLVPFIELGVGFNPELTGRENVYLNGALLGFSEKEIEEMYEDIVAFAELERFMDQKLKNYSSGMQVRLAFSMATRSEAEVLLIDEVLAVGDADFQRKCFGYFKQLKKNNKTVVFVSHDMEAVREYCDSGVLVEENKILRHGSSEVIAREYTKLFLQSNVQTSGQKKDDVKRWGTGGIKFDDVRAEIRGEQIVVTAMANARSELSGIRYGIHIFGLDGKEICAVNNRMIEYPDLKLVKKGKTVEFNWEVLNVFSDGAYSVTLTLVDSDGEVLDWFTDAASFMVRRTRRSTTAILPPISVKSTIRT